jgi:hypothetical protein
MLSGVKPLWLVCEDGTEYVDRFGRFLDAEFEFVRVADGPELVERLAMGAVAGVILDLDFRRTPPERLVDDEGVMRAALPDELRRQLGAAQGILILRLVRARGFTVPVLLFADLEDAGQTEYLERTLAPLAVVPGHEGLVQTAARLRAMSAG